MKKPIYMDHHATTPVDPRVVEVMIPYFSEKFGNAASRSHVYGWDAADAVEKAREQIGRVVGAAPREIVFTSGATESDNLALKGLAARNAHKGNHIITSQIEHSAVLDTAMHLEQAGLQLTYVPVGSDGVVDPEDVRKAITGQTILISIMAVNNEIGTIQPFREIGKIAREHGVLFHTDAVQAIGRIPVDVNDDNIDLLSISAHKVYGPKGVGALYVRRRNPRVRLTPIIDGGGHEHGLRSGTLPVPLIVGFGRALEIAAAEMAEEAPRIGALRDRLRKVITEKLEGVFMNGSETSRLPHNLNLTFRGVNSESVLVEMKDIALSSGSACASTNAELSHVLKALGIDEALIHSSIRFGLGRSNTVEEVDYVAAQVIEAVERMRKVSPLSQRKSVHERTVLPETPEQ